MADPYDVLFGNSQNSSLGEALARKAAQLRTGRGMPDPLPFGSTPPLAPGAPQSPQLGQNVPAGPAPPPGGPQVPGVPRNQPMAPGPGGTPMPPQGATPPPYQMIPMGPAPGTPGPGKPGEMGPLPGGAPMTPRPDTGIGVHSAASGIPLPPEDPRNKGSIWQRGPMLNARGEEGQHQFTMNDAYNRNPSLAPKPGEAAAPVPMGDKVAPPGAGAHDLANSGAVSKLFPNFGTSPIGKLGGAFGLW